MAADNIELQTLKARADELGIQYADSIGVKKLSERIAEKEKELAESDETGETKPTDSIYIPKFPILHNNTLYREGKPLPEGLLSEKEADTLFTAGVIEYDNNQ